MRNLHVDAIQSFVDSWSFDPSIFWGDTQKNCKKKRRFWFGALQDDLSPCPKSTPKTQKDQGGLSSGVGQNDLEEYQIVNIDKLVVEMFQAGW